jgi:hypothetical protein
MYEPTPIDVIASIADSEGDIAPSLARIIRAYIKEMDGEEGFGKELARISRDEDMTPSVRASVMNNVLRLVGQTHEGDRSPLPVDDKQLDAIEQALYGDREAANGS